jgi:hypothetical protein
MLTPLVALLRSIRLMCCGQRAIALENLALRQQVAALKRTVNRPKLRTRDGLFWVLLANRERPGPPSSSDVLRSDCSVPFSNCREFVGKNARNHPAPNRTPHQQNCAESGSVRVHICRKAA